MSDRCICLTAGLTILNNEVSSAIIPEGIQCTFFQSMACFTNRSAEADEVGVSGSVSNFTSLTGTAGQNFNDLTSSFVCSPA
ncbi:hypothetical protein CVT26_006464 [Gymnopilus dilepis]|uniref:Uncharacterized protein n=1 Tax=Gymnopilus dilepis TaxID=231916 RepID=A0A409YTX9_9AGAR|nr:hypothetical protein CVT26_006464 [Gymnopilus dilepis]